MLIILLFKIFITKNTEKKQKVSYTIEIICHNAVIPIQYITIDDMLIMRIHDGYTMEKYFALNLLFRFFSLNLHPISKTSVENHVFRNLQNG